MTTMTPEQLSTTILAIVGIFLQLIFKYVPAAAAWYQNHANKGALMLGMVALTGGAYYALACSPFAAQLGIAIACSTDSVFLLLKAIFIVASSQQLAYLFTRGTSG